MNDDSLDMFGEDGALDATKALEAVGSPHAFRWEGTLRDMMDAVRLALEKQHIEKTAIERIAPTVVMQLCDTLGGQIAYLPRGAAVKRAIRDARLFENWKNGAKPHELSAAYKIAVQTVYEIIHRQRALARRNEPDLFGFDNIPPETV